MTDSTPELCCTHGEALVQRIERAVELMEDVHAARVEQLATGGAVTGPAGPVVGGGCVIPVNAAMVPAANPSPAIDPQALAEAVAEGTIAELDRQGRLRF